MVSVGSSCRVSRAAAAAAFHFTYTIGDTFYVPLTSQCQLNAVTTLPQSRGPGFSLSMDVIRALQNVRKIEGFDTSTSTSTSGVSDESEKGLVRELLPPIQYSSDGNKDSDQELLVNLLNNDWSTIFNGVDMGGNGKASGLPKDMDKLLIKELEDYIMHSGIKACSTQTDFVLRVAFAGEGEPLMRPQELLWFSRKISDLAQSHQCNLNLRVVTNGIVHPSAAKVLSECGVTGVSVALMTADQQQYQDIMGTTRIDDILSVHYKENIDDQMCKTCHDQVCKFIKEAIHSGLDVELTGLDRADIDKKFAESLGNKLGVDSSRFRWRPYFT